MLIITSVCEVSVVHVVCFRYLTLKFGALDYTIKTCGEKNVLN